MKKKDIGYRPMRCGTACRRQRKMGGVRGKRRGHRRKKKKGTA